MLTALQTIGPMAGLAELSIALQAMRHVEVSGYGLHGQQQSSETGEQPCGSGQELLRALHTYSL